MSRLRSILSFLYDFVIGDDPWIAALVVIAFGITAALCAAGLNAWPILPVAALAGLTWSVLRAARAST